MSAAFPGPYTDLGLTQRPPFSQVSEAVDVTNPRDLGQNRSYQNDLGQTLRSLDLSAQQTPPKPFPPNKWLPGRDPYANGGGGNAYLEHSAS
jgi:hypothetical protein